MPETSTLDWASFMGGGQFAVKNFFVISENKTQSDSWKFRILNTRHLVSWQISNYPKGLLKPGKSDSSFSLVTTGLPRPYIYFLKGNNGDVSFDADDLVNNSVTGFTLGPYNPPDPFDAGTLTDSLRAYTTRACELEWITNKGVCNSLEKKLLNVNRQLERGNTRTAANNLQAFLNEVEAVRRNQLTSEGYGLLWFNGQYLLEQLTE